MAKQKFKIINWATYNKALINQGSLTFWLDTLDVVNQLAQLTATHSHNNTGTPLNALAITDTGAKTAALKVKYDPVIAPSDS